MEANELCVSKDTAIRLQDKGFPQGKSYFVWCEDKYRNEWVTLTGDRDRSKDWDTVVDAPTTDELLAELPGTVTIFKRKEEFEVTDRLGVLSSLWNESLPEALALLWLKVKGEHDKDSRS